MKCMRAYWTEESRGEGNKNQVWSWGWWGKGTMLYLRTVERAYTNAGGLKGEMGGGWFWVAIISYTIVP